HCLRIGKNWSPNPRSAYDGFVTNALRAAFTFVHLSSKSIEKLVSRPMTMSSGVFSARFETEEQPPPPSPPSSPPWNEEPPDDEPFPPPASPPLPLPVASLEPHPGAVNTTPPRKAANVRAMPAPRLLPFIPLAPLAIAFSLRTAAFRRIDRVEPRCARDTC